MTREEEDLLVEQVAGAHRPAAGDELQYHKAWHDLGADARVRAFDLAAALARERISITADSVPRRLWIIGATSIEREK